MSIRNIDWIDGPPSKCETGMVVQWHNDSISLAGTDSDFEGWDNAKRHGYLIQPHELDWLADISTKNAKGRPEQ